MDEWQNTPWIYQGWVPVAGGIILFVALALAVVWFIDGIRKYGYWLKGNKDEK